MSDEWCPDHDGSHCYALRDLAERVSRLESGAAVSTERAILTDLIAELRRSMVDLADTRYVVDEGLDLYLPFGLSIDRAEARLKGLSNE